MALVGASPAYYRHHLLNRRRLLCNALSISLGSTVADALAVYQSKQPECMARQYPEDTRQFVQSYQQRSVDDVSEEEATKLASFHTFVVQPLINYYVTWAMEHLAAESECPQDEVGPSLTEQKRIIRAFYRFQVCCNLFGKSADDSGWHNFTPVQILRLFFCKFQPWEVEEIACVYDFAKEIYDQAYRDLLCDEREQSPGLEGESPDASEMIFDLEDEGQSCINYPFFFIRALNVSLQKLDQPS